MSETAVKPTNDEITFGGKSKFFKTLSGKIVEITSSEVRDDGCLYIVVEGDSMDGVNDPSIARWLTSYHLHGHGFGGGTSGMDPMHGGGNFLREKSTKERPIYMREFRFTPRP